MGVGNGVGEGARVGVASLIGVEVREVIGWTGGIVPIADCVGVAEAVGAREAVGWTGGVVLIAYCVGV